MRSFTAIAVPLLVLSTFAKNDKGKESCSFSTSCRHEIEVLTANEGSECIEFCGVCDRSEVDECEVV